jgi:hypothetical protein
VDIRTGKHGREYPYTLYDTVWSQLHGGQYVNDNLCFTCANAKSVQHRCKPLSYADFNPAGYGKDDFIQLGKWLEYLHPLYKAALLRPP